LPINLEAVSGQDREGQALSTRFTGVLLNGCRSGFKLRNPLPEAVATEFEERHEVVLPAAYRLFVTELGDGGAGPGYHLSPLSEACHLGCPQGHLARPSRTRGERSNCVRTAHVLLNNAFGTRPRLQRKEFRISQCSQVRG
jgi:hypothetical protein